MPTVSLPTAPALLTENLRRGRDAPLPLCMTRKSSKIHGFGNRLMPANYRRRIARPVSYYALF